MKRLIPVFTLAILSPFIAEIVFGATPLTRIASFPPLILLYGGGAVLIRELARRTVRPWTAILCLGTAYGLIEEGLVMQTIFSPDLFGAAACGLRFAGVNWVWTEALLGYHTVWSIAIPIALTELCFPERRHKPWLGRIGTAVALACYALGAASISIVFRRIVTPNFRAPAISLVTAAVVAAALVLWAIARNSANAALALQAPAPGPAAAPQPQSGSPAKLPPAWLACAVALAAAGLWMGLFTLPQFLRIGIWPLLPMTLAAFLAWGVYRRLRAWSDAGWTDLHLLATITGAVLASAAYGVDVVKQASRLDRAGQAVCSIAFLALLAVIAGLLKRRIAAA